MIHLLSQIVLDGARYGQAMRDGAGGSTYYLLQKDEPLQTSHCCRNPGMTDVVPACWISIEESSDAAEMDVSYPFGT
jgi:hypothetical protein